MDDLGAVLGSIGMTVEPDEGTRIADAILITKEIDMSTGDVRVGAYWTDTLDKDWITRNGMHSAAEIYMGSVFVEEDE